MPLLDRAKAIEEARLHFLARHEALSEMVDFGAQLVQRAYEASRKSPTDLVVVGVLLKQVVAMADGVEVLARAGAVHAAFPQARAALEALLYLEWILLSDSDYKADCYLMANVRHERAWSGKAMTGSPEGIAFGRLAGELGFEAQPPSAVSIEAQDPDLTYPALSTEALRDGAVDPGQRFSKFGRAQWFHLTGAGSLRRIAQQVGRLPQYHFWYAQEPHVTHSGLYRDHVQPGDGEPRLREVRGLAHADELLRSTMQILLGACASVLRHYRPDELGEFSARYGERWRSHLLG